MRDRQRDIEFCKLMIDGNLEALKLCETFSQRRRIRQAVHALLEVADPPKRRKKWF